MDCTVCNGPFDKQARRPKCLPCGHTLCLGCVQDLASQECPLCHQKWTQPELPDNLLAINMLEAATTTPQVDLWCSDCREPPFPSCLDEHDVQICRVLLRKCLRDVVPLTKQQLDGLHDGVQDGDVVTALRMLHGAPASFKLSVRQDDGRAFDADWRTGEDPLLQALVVALATRGRLLKIPKPPVPKFPAPPSPKAVEPLPENPSGGMSASVSGQHAETVDPVEQEGQAKAPGSEHLKDHDYIDALDVEETSRTSSGRRQEEKAKALALVRQKGVRRLTYVFCHKDPVWALDLLQSAALTVQELRIYNPHKAHILAVHAMPSLTRMVLDGSGSTLDTNPIVLPARVATLRWLRVSYVPRPTLVSLLQAHSATLKVLWLYVGLPGEGGFPKNCNDLDALLGQCGLRMPRVVLWREKWSHEKEPCAVQLVAVKRVLANATVQCSWCDRVPDEAL